MNARAGGMVFSSPLGGGTESLRYTSTPGPFYVKEAPTVNFIIRKHIFLDLINSVIDVYPGEEIVLCGEIIHNLKKQILYDPSVIVYHHRRSLFIPHLKQVWNYGLVKGSLVNNYFKYVRVIFFIPSFFLLFLILGGVSLIYSPHFIEFYLFTITIYLLVTLFFSLKIFLSDYNFHLTTLIFLGIISTHLIYGLSFMIGIFRINKGT